MAGTLFGLGLSQQVDINGRPLSGCLLYTYFASTSTPANAYQDFGLSVLLPNPIPADSSGRLPAFWMADGTYRAVLTDSSGVVIFDLDGIAAIGASSAGGGGGGGTVVDPTAIMQTGFFMWSPITGTMNGFVRANARTIGSVASGATERANADTQLLYIYLWTQFADSLCPVGGGRGVSGLADFTANKPIGTLDMRDCGMFGLDDMGNTALGGIITGTPTVAGSKIGAEKATISIAQANLPSYNLSLASLTATATATINYDTNTFGTTSSPNRNVVTAISASASGVVGATLPNPSVAIGGTLPSGGSGTALTPTTISPGRFGTVYIKL